MLVKIILDNIEYDILYSPIKSKKKVKFYKPLAIALWSKLTEERKKTLIIINPYNEHHKILNFDKLLECYLYGSKITHEFNLVTAKWDTPEKERFKDYNSEKPGCCWCGVPIKDIGIIQNIDSKIYFKMGCECIKWWKCEKDISNIKQIMKAIKNNKEIPKFCPFCKLSLKKCKDCEDKQNIKNIFTKWRIYSNMKITNLITDLNSKVYFGKYKTEIYYKLCQDISYVNYILNKDFNENIIYKIRSYIKYKHLLNKENYKKRL